MLQRRARPNNHLPVDANSVGLSIRYHNRLNLTTSGGGMLYARTHLLPADLRSVNRRLFASTPGGPHRKRTSSAVNTRARGGRAHAPVLRVRRKLLCVAELYELLQRLARRHDTILFLRLSSRSSTSGSQCPDVQLLFGRTARDTTWQAIAGSRARGLCVLKKFVF